MPIQINYVVQTQRKTQKQVQKEKASIRLIDKNDFVEMFHRNRPTWVHNSQQLHLNNLDLFWDYLLGHISWAVHHGQHKKATYLTEESASLILQHFEKFVSGFDFYHRPSGFLRVKNPETGVMDVLHYSSYVDALQSTKAADPLAIQLHLSEPMLEGVNDLWTLNEHQNDWYERLKTKCEWDELPRGQYICSEEALRSAFICFSQRIEAMGLVFYAPKFDASFFNQPVNPIVLLARWEAVLRNPHLKVEDRQAQWEVILQLRLERGWDAIRALSDYEHDRNPCGMLLPEMELDHLNFYENEGLSEEDKGRWGFRSVLYPKDIHTQRDFWRYIAFQPKRHTIQFYQSALTAIQQITLIDEEHRLELIQMLAGASTRSNAAAHRVEEQQMLGIWEEMCGIIGRWETMNLIVQGLDTIGLLFDETKKSMRENLIEHLSRLETPPNIEWLNMMFGYIKYFFSQPSIIFDQDDPLNRLSDQLNFVVSRLGNGTYKGAKFWVSDPDWVTKGIKLYIEKQHRLLHLSQGEKHRLCGFGAHLSTFNIQDEESYSRDLESLNFDVGQQALLHFSLSILEDIQKSLAWSEFFEFCLLINQGQIKTEMGAIDELERQFSSFFEEDYFVDKRQMLLSALQGLTPKEQAWIDQLDFSEEQLTAVKNILAQTKKNISSLSSEDFQALALKFNGFIQAFSSKDVTQFFNHFANMAVCINNLDVLNDFLVTLMEKRVFSEFEYVYFRNQKVQSSSYTLEKFTYYIANTQIIIEGFPRLEKIHLQNFFAMYLLYSDPQAFDPNHFQNLLEKLNRIIDDNPHIQNYIFLSLHAIADDHADHYCRQVENFIDTLERIHGLLQTKNSDLVVQNLQIFYTLLAKYSKNTQACIYLFQTLENSHSTPEQIRFMIGLINRLLEKNQSLEEIQSMLEEMIALTDDEYQHFTHCYQQAPYPPFEFWKAWGKTPETRMEQYDQFSLSPFGLRKLEYAFNLGHYHQQKSKFYGLVCNGQLFAPDEVFTDALGQQFDRLLKENRQKSIQVLQDIYHNPASDQVSLLCAVIELLARTTAQRDLTSDRQISQELNTTQVMAVYAALSYGNPKLLMNVDTGEGKTRTLMTLAACKKKGGYTIDFMTSDLPLAERDYFAYKTFFNVLDIPTSLITLATPELLYQHQGLNFSNNEELQLVRNKSDIAHQRFSFLASDPTKRCLLLDEIDKFKKDKSNDACNYATQSLKFSEFTWIYTHLVQFMLQEDQTKKIGKKVEYQDKKQAFLQYLMSHETDLVCISHIHAMDKLYPDLLSTWLYSADMAIKKMTLNEDYVITDTLFPIYDSEGNLRMSKKVWVLTQGRPAKDALFSEGLHQCLVALLNIQAGEAQYVIPPEVETQRTSYPVAFFKQYDQGQMIGMSGTTQSEAPIADPVINHENNGYLVVPREHALQREDKNIWGAKDQSQQIQFMKSALLDHLSQDHSILIICKDDNQSLSLFNVLSKDAVLKNITRVHGLSSEDEEKKAICEAGNAAQITISTAGMFSRGVDIEADHLCVISAYVPTLVDDIQIKGRTARAGKKGTYQLILDLSDSDAGLNGKTYNIYNEVERYQHELAVNSAFQQHVSELYGLFLEDMTQLFLDTRPSPDQTEQWLLVWQSFLSQMQQNWENHREVLLTQLKNNQKEMFVSNFKQFMTQWRDGLQTHFPTVQFNEENELIQTADKLFESAMHQVNFFQPKRQAIKRQQEYDPSDDGQARIYEGWFVQLKASLRGDRPWNADYRAWQEGRGVLFPNLMAALNGEYSFFTELLAMIQGWLNALQEWVSEVNPFNRSVLQ